MTWRVVIPACALAILGACGGSSSPSRAARETTATAPPADAASREPALSSLDIEMDEGNDGVAALSRAALGAGCKVQGGEQGGHPSVIAECREGIFGAVQVDRTLSIRCVDMPEPDCELFVLSILDAVELSGSDSESSGAPAPAIPPTP